LIEQRGNVSTLALMAAATMSFTTLRSSRSHAKKEATIRISLGGR
jgi:hypothetical protein